MIPCHFFNGLSIKLDIPGKICLTLKTVTLSLKNEWQIFCILAAYSYFFCQTIFMTID